MRNFLAKRLQVSKKSLPLHPQLRENNAERQSEKKIAKKVLKNLVVTKKCFTFVPTFASENAAIFLAPLRKGRNQKGSLIYWFNREKKNAEAMKS